MGEPGHPLLAAARTLPPGSTSEIFLVLRGLSGRKSPAALFLSNRVKKKKRPPINLEKDEKRAHALKIAFSMDFKI